jgi:hypothetical protein
VPGKEGELWLAGEGGLFRSVDGGASVVRVDGVTSAVNIGFGKAAEGKTYPALYAVADLGSGNGVYRSDDVGANWVRINDDRHQFGNMGEAITGDPRVYGRVYLGTNGRGILYADPAGPPPVTSTTSSTSTSPSTSPSTTSSTTTTTVPPVTCRVDYKVSSQWTGGFTASVKITNTGVNALSRWALKFTFPSGQVISNAWNGKASQTDAVVTVTNEGWNGTIPAGGSVEFGFQASWQGSNVNPTGYTLNGGPCSA